MKRKVCMSLQLILVLFIFSVLPINATENNTDTEILEENINDIEEEIKEEETTEEGVPETETTEESVPEEKLSIEIKDGEVNTTGEATIKKGNGYVTFVGHVNPEIQQTIYIGFFNMKTYEEYAYYLYQVNNYRTSVELPAGDYFLTDGGIPNDVMGEYSIENVQFTVRPNEASIVDFGVGMSKNQIGAYGGEEDLVTIKIEGETNDEAETEAIESVGSGSENGQNQLSDNNKGNKISGIIINAVIVVVFICGVLLVYTIIKKNREEDE